MTWADIDFDEKVIVIKGVHAKLRKRRRVEMSDNLILWLTPYQLKSGKVTPSTNYRGNFDAVKHLAGWRGDREEHQDNGRPYWVTDIMRHTSISNHCTIHKHEGATATWAGTSPTMLHKRYRGLISEADAKAFWQIAPSDKEPVRGTFKEAVVS